MCQYKISLLFREFTLTAGRTHSAILLVVDGNLIWARCALASDEARGSKQYLEEETCHGVADGSGGWLSRERSYGGIGPLYTKMRSRLGSSSYPRRLTWCFASQQ